ncbi:MAG: aminopeptidase P N-terminal domain-containing protein [Deltaproteobacteria bacterium]|nr:aminopeptidase P N-terminal domain-containing protein [Nannocystaceae bacterium]
MVPLDASARTDIYAARRARIAARLGDAALVLYGGELRTRSNDTEYRFRPDSDFHYLTGLREPGAIMVLRGNAEPRFVLFVRPRDAEAEVWSGRRVGPEGATGRYGADLAHPLDELTEQLPKLLDGAKDVHLPIGRWRALDGHVMRAIDHLRRRNRWGETPPELIHDARATVGEDRIVKDVGALAALRRAADITVDAHLAAMAATRGGAHEYEIEALIEYEFRRRGADGPGYGSIVGAGDNATILHYVDNDARMHDGQLLLIDAGAEVELFSADLTRTLPVSGRFSPAQRELYEIVLAANRAGIALATVGSDIDTIHRACLRVLCEGLHGLGLIDGTVDDALEHEHYKPYYMHRTSHWLGADVHDAGYYTLARQPRPLQPGYVLTVEPGLYVAADDARAPAELRGCGIRIEDDVLVRTEGPEVLTARAPKSIEDVETAMAR